MPNNKLCVCDVVACVLPLAYIEDMICQGLTFASSVFLIFLVFAFVIASRGFRLASASIAIASISSSTALWHLLLCSYREQCSIDTQCQCRCREQSSIFSCVVIESDCSIDTLFSSCFENVDVESKARSYRYFLSSYRERCSIDTSIFF